MLSPDKAFLAIFLNIHGKANNTQWTVFLLPDLRTWSRGFHGIKFNIREWIVTVHSSTDKFCASLHLLRIHYTFKALDAV